jgi:hypothetical protein
MRVVGVVDGVPAVAGAAGSRTNKTTPGRARRSRVCTSVMGLSLSSGASATSSGARARAMAMFAVSRSPSLRSKRAGESATQPLISTTTQDPIATAPRRRHRPRRLSGHRSGAGWRRRWPRRRRAGWPSRRWGSWSCRCSGGRTAEPALTARMIRYYEKRGGIPSLSRRARAHRRYTEHDVEQLRVLRRLLAAGLPMEEAVDFPSASNEA